MICFKTSSYNSLTERQGDYLSSGFFLYAYMQKILWNSPDKMVM